MNFTSSVISNDSAFPMLHEVAYTLELTRGPNQVDGAPADLKEIINIHWTKFPPQNQLLNQVLACFYFLFWIVNGVGNTAVITLFLRNKSLQTPANVFVTNLAIADLFMMMSQGPFFIFNVMRSRWWSFGVFACEFYGFTGGVFGVAAIMSMVMIGIDRFLVITQGISGPRFKMQTALFGVYFIWTYAIGVNLPPLTRLWSRFTPEGLLTTCSFDYLNDDPWAQDYVLFIFSSAYAVPLSILVLCYSRIVITVWAHEKTLKVQAKKMNVDSLRATNNDKTDSVEMRIAKAALCSVLLWVVIWSPYAVVTIVGAFGDKSLITPVVSMIPALLAKSASCVNPIVFAISHPRFQQAFMKEFSFLFCCSGKQTDKEKLAAGSDCASVATTATEKV